VNQEKCIFEQTCNINATTNTVMKRVAVSNNWKFKSIGFPMIQPTTTQKGICIIIALTKKKVQKTN